MKTGWIVFAFAAAGFASVVGTPHILLSAECSMFGDRCLTSDIACHYVGIQGQRLAFPVVQGGGLQRCSSVAFLPLQWPLF